MKYLNNILIWAVGTMLFVSCEGITTEGVTSVTNYVSLNLEGELEYFTPLGVPYVEPGFSAILEEADVTKDVAVSGSVDTSTPGVYNLIYSAVNKEGFKIEKTRTVYVYDATDSSLKSGVYTVNKNSYRDLGGVKTPYKDTYPVVIYQIDPGTFYISDFIGGWYDKGSGYGVDYAMVGTFKLKPDNTIEALTNEVPGWGDSMDVMNNALFTPATNSISWEIGYGGGAMVFYVTLNK